MLCGAILISFFLVVGVFGKLTATPSLIPLGYAMTSASLTEPAERQSCRESKSFADMPLKELTKAVPELKGLEAAETQEELAPHLQKLGEGVKVLFASFPDITSIEDTRQERLSREMSVMESVSEEFRYLALAHPFNGGVTLEEYRTDSKGRRIEPGGTGRGTLVITKGFVSQPLFFHPLYQSESTFRYLGRQIVGGRQAFVIAFAQRPDKARLVGGIEIGGTAHRVLFQGVAWITAADYHIVRMRTDLLPPLPKDLERETTEIHFAAVRLKDVPNALQLPCEVVVTLVWRGTVLRNQHRYSDFRLFRVQTRVLTEENRHAPEPPPR